MLLPKRNSGCSFAVSKMEDKTQFGIDIDSYKIIHTNMKQILTLVIAALFIGNVAVASEPSSSNSSNNSFTIKTSKASKVLVEAWAKAYMQTHTDVSIVVTSKQSATADLTYTNEDTQEKDVTFVGRYAILPITSEQNPLLGELQQKEWTKSDLKKLYFTSLDDEFGDEEDANRGKAGKLREKLTVYSGANASSNAGVFAKYFGFQPAELRGNKISGDDIYLLNAIGEDKQSITFNSVAYVFDTKSRKLKNGIAIIPIKVSDEIKTALQEGNLDATLKVLESESSDLIPVERFGFTSNYSNPSAQLFLEWVVSEGQQLNNQNGFLRLSENDARKQSQQLSQR